ncbi:MAG: dTDP-4-dehydrorhamnose 3,5-epimerase family protein [Patescibacteria group bacterium]|nr:dTDP-4-dehydrorhamnose 3,5-epimerase family protein [Patescibacteria group bacterium]
MINGVVIKKIAKFTDHRGWLAEAYRNDETDFKPVMTYISETKSGVVRGPHEHQGQSDFFIFIVGQFRLYLWDNRQGADNYRVLETYDVGGDNPCSVIIPPGVVHAYKCLSESGGITINLPDALYAGPGKQAAVDEIRWEVMAASPFIVS